MRIAKIVTLSVALFLLNNVNAQESFPNNSTRKIRVKPSKTANRIGTGVDWQKSFEDAEKRSQDTGKPLFWYVPTLSGSFMDRKTEIDRYMMAGPFSWESTRNLLNDRFITVKAQPDGSQRDKFKLKPYEFVEPGFLILSPQGEVLKKVDRITTLHPKWFYSLLASTIENPAPFPISKDHAAFYQALEIGNHEQYELLFHKANGNNMKNIENLMVLAMVTFRRGYHEAATALFKSIAKKYPDHPLGWKAAAEAEGFGPFVRGFEVHRQIPDAALRAGTQSKGSAAPKGTFSEQEIWKRGVEFLLGMQRSDGGWVDCDYDFGGTDSLPNVHIAVTSLSAMSLLSAKKHVNDALGKRIDKAIKRAVRYVTDDKNFNRHDKDELFWAYAYRARFLSRLVKSDGGLRDSFNAACKSLENIQSKGGAWFHEYRNPFVTATALCALAEAKAAGFEVDDSKIRKGVASLSGDRFQNGAYPYSTRGGGNHKKPGTIQQVAASAGRMPLCELGLQYWGAADQESLEAAVDQSMALHMHLTSALKYDDHTSNMAYGGFFFWYDMRARSEAISHIVDAGKRTVFAQRQKALILTLPELDGCFVDSHELGRCYGTAMALLSLARLNEEQN